MKFITAVFAALLLALFAIPAQAASVDLSPLVDMTFSYLAPVIAPALLALILSVADKFPIIKVLVHSVDAKVLDAYIQTAISYGVDIAKAKIDPKVSSVDFKNQVANVAASWLADQIPQRLSRLGISPESVRDRVLAYVPGHAEVQAALAVPATITLVPQPAA